MAGSRKVVDNWETFQIKPEWLQRGNHEKIIINLELLSSTIQEDHMLNAEILSRNTDISKEERFEFVKAIFDKNTISFKAKLRLFKAMMFVLSDELASLRFSSKDEEQKSKNKLLLDSSELLYAITVHMRDPSPNIAIFNEAYENYDESTFEILSAAYSAASDTMMKTYETLKKNPFLAMQKIGSSSTSTQSSSAFEGLIAIGSKTGGANVGGEHTGLYRGKMIVNQGTKEKREEMRLCLIKQDFARSELRIEKIIGERIGGSILQHLYHDHLSAPYDQFAEVRLIRDDTNIGEKIKPDDNGEHTYLQSIYINNYKDDLWKYAYYKHFEKENIKKIKSGELDIREINEVIIAISEKVKKITERYEHQKKPGWKVLLQKDAKYIKYMKLYSLLNKLSNVNELSKLPSNDPTIKTLSKQLAHLQADKLKRPTGVKFGVFETGVRAVIDSLIQNDDKLKRDFAIMAAPRLLIGDFGLHNGNFGIALVNGEVSLVSLDYGAAFLNPIEDINPYTIRQTGIRGYEKIFKKPFSRIQPGSQRKYLYGTRLYKTWEN